MKIFKLSLRILLLPIIIGVATICLVPCTIGFIVMMVVWLINFLTNNLDGDELSDGLDVMQQPFILVYNWIVCAD